MTPLSLLFPELLLAIAPLLAVYFWRGRSSALGGFTRLLILVVLTLMAAVPVAPIGGKGIDVIVVVDLSRSMPTGSRPRALEIVKLIEDLRGSGDRVGVVSYGRDARIERLPEELAHAADFVQEVDPDGSDLGNAIAVAANLIPRNRPGRLIVLSDGEANGVSPVSAAREAIGRGISIDVRPFSRDDAADVAVEALDLPGTVDEREPFQFTASVRSDRTVDAEAVLTRDGVEIARTKGTFQPGVTQLTFRDVIDAPGVAAYRLELTADRDRIPENNRGDGAVQVDAPPTILLVNATGRPDNLSRALAAGKLPVHTVPPSGLPDELSRLVAFRAVILENVPVDRLPQRALASLARFATELGGGLLLTGGRGSFGVGGYFKSVLDPYLPVSMEVKNEHRKLSLAMAVALDRSGSMAVPVPDGRTKMDLANLGTCAAIDTLGPFDEVAVVAVDSAAHVISPLVPAQDKDRICDEVRRIQSMGGGIFTYTALVTAAQLVQQSDKGTRHIVLFADAADAEEPGEYRRLLDTITPLGITVSVIALGSETDSDADFLKDIASRGRGRIHFTAGAADLPRLFAQEAITTARSSFITEPTAARALPDMTLLGDLPASRFPTLDGYNLTYLRPGATMGVVTSDEYKAPVLAFWHQGLGRVAALTPEVDGEYSQHLNRWSEFQAFSIGLGRWLLGGNPPSTVQASIDRAGGEGIVRVELDPARMRGAADDVRGATATIVPPGDVARATPGRLTLRWVADDALEARFPLQSPGVYLGAVQVNTGAVLPLPPLSLPYSPEFEPRADAHEGLQTLREIARVTGGRERTAWDDVFTVNRSRNRQVRDLVMPLAVAVLMLHVLEIAGRRLLLFAAAREWLRTVRLPRLRYPSFGRDSGRAAPPPATGVQDEAGAALPASTPPPQPASALARAKNKARSRMGATSDRQGSL